MSCGADTISNDLMTSLLAGTAFTVPVINPESSDYTIPELENSQLYAAVTRLTNADLTTGDIGGTGAFDALMRGFKSHLDVEFESGRITGAEYTKAYIALTESAMANATQFVLGREQAYWAAQTAQLEALTRRIEADAQRVRLAATLLEANTLKVNYARAKIGLANEDTQFCISKFNLENILPAQKEQLDIQNEKILAEKDLLEGEVDMLPIKSSLLQEQLEVQRAQTLDTRSDGLTPVAGSVGKQKELYTQQITAYQRDSEIKAAKIFSDAWITQKTIDEGLLAPSLFTNASVDHVLAAIKTNNNLLGDVVEAGGTNSTDGDDAGGGTDPGDGGGTDGDPGGGTTDPGGGSDPPTDGPAIP